MYVDIGRGASDTVTLAIALSAANAVMDRSWDIKVSQISCTSADRYVTHCTHRISPLFSKANAQFSSF